MVTIVRGLSPEENDLPSLLTKLKASCGAGGTIKDGLLEIQGNHFDRVRDLLRDTVYRVQV